MPETGTSGLMSGEGKRVGRPYGCSVPRPSSTLLSCTDRAPVLPPECEVACRPNCHVISRPASRNCLLFGLAPVLAIAELRTVGANYRGEILNRSGTRTKRPTL